MLLPNGGNSWLVVLLMIEKGAFADACTTIVLYVFPGKALENKIEAERRMFQAECSVCMAGCPIFKKFQSLW